MALISIQKSFLRYAIVGFGSNLALYLFYLLLTEYFIGHKSAMTIAYIIGVMANFVFNRKWSFEHRGSVYKSMGRYLFIVLIAYVINYWALYYFVDVLGYAHQLVQVVMIFAIAIFLFLMQKIWVFGISDKHAGN